MKAKFIGVPGEKLDSIHMYGQDYKLGEDVEVKDPRAAAKLKNHPHFEVQETEEDRKIMEQVRRDYSASAQAGLMEAEALAIRRQQVATEPAPPPAPPPEPNLRPLRSATEYQQVVEGAGVGSDLQTALKPEEEAQKEGEANGNADAERPGRAGAAQAQGSGPKAGGKR